VANYGEQNGGGGGADRVQVRRVGLTGARRCCGGCACDSGNMNAISLWGFVGKREDRGYLYMGRHGRGASVWVGRRGSDGGRESRDQAGH
jgi:hypothetical protein